MENKHFIPISDFCEHHHLEISFIRILEDSGLIQTTVYQEIQCLEPESIEQVEKYVRLHHDLDIHPQDLDIIDSLLHKIDQIQRKLNQLQHRIRFYEGLQ